MLTFRLLPAIAAITLCATPFLTRADDTPAQAAARAALMQDMNDTGNAETPAAPPAQTPPPPVQTPPPETVAPAPVTPAPAMTETQGSPTTVVVPPVETEIPATNQATSYPVNPAPANAASNSMWPSANTNTPSMTSGAMSEPQASEPPMTAPSLPVSESQQQQLQALLQQYVANQITSAQYQAQRAKILAGQ